HGSAPLPRDAFTRLCLGARLRFLLLPLRGLRLLRLRLCVGRRSGHGRHRDHGAGHRQQSRCGDVAHPHRSLPAVEPVASFAGGTTYIFTPLSKRIRSPFSLTSSRLALTVPLVRFPATGALETIVFFLMSTAASLSFAV